MKNIVFLLFAVFVIPIYAIDDITYSANIDGRVVFKDSQVTIDVLDYPDNVKNHEYTIQEISQQEYLIVNSNKYLMLRSESFLFLVDNTNKNIFFGIANSGKLMEFISPANKYKETSFLEENGFRYIAKNMSYLKGNLPYVEGMNDFGKKQQVTMNFLSNIN